MNGFLIFAKLKIKAIKIFAKKTLHFVEFDRKPKSVSLCALLMYVCTVCACACVCTDTLYVHLCVFVYTSAHCTCICVCRDDDQDLVTGYAVVGYLAKITVWRKKSLVIFHLTKRC